MSEFEPQPIFTQGQTDAFKNHLERSTRSAQSAILSAEFSFKTTHRLNVLKRRKLRKQIKDAQREINKHAPALAKLQLEEAADAASAELG